MHSRSVVAHAATAFTRPDRYFFALSGSRATTSRIEGRQSLLAQRPRVSRFATLEQPAGEAGVLATSRDLSLRAAFSSAKHCRQLDLSRRHVCRSSVDRVVGVITG